MTIVREIATDAPLMDTEAYQWMRPAPVHVTPNFTGTQLLGLIQAYEQVARIGEVELKAPLLLQFRIGEAIEALEIVKIGYDFRGAYCIIGVIRFDGRSRDCQVSIRGENHRGRHMDIVSCELLFLTE